MSGNPIWVQIALAEQGQAELAGAQHNPRIVEYHATTGFRAKDDETPWCASFVGWCLEQAELRSAASAAARSYETWGVPLEKPVLGAVVTFTRQGGGHVGFYMGERGGKWLILGGNQSNRVSIALYDPARMTSIRWPADTPPPGADAPLRRVSSVAQAAKTPTGKGAVTITSLGAGAAALAPAVQARAGLPQWTGVALVLAALAGASLYVLVKRRDAA